MAIKASSRVDTCKFLCCVCSCSFLLDCRLSSFLGLQLVLSYLAAFQITGANGLAAVARGVLDYLRRDMTHPEGGLYSAEVRKSLICCVAPYLLLMFCASKVTR